MFYRIGQSLSSTVFCATRRRPTQLRFARATRHPTRSIEAGRMAPPSSVRRRVSATKGLSSKRVVAICDTFLAPNYLLTTAQAICLHPGEVARGLHYDDSFRERGKRRSQARAVGTGRRADATVATRS